MADVTRQYKVHYETPADGHYPGNSSATETSNSRGVVLEQTTVTMGQTAKASNRGAIFLVFRLGGIPPGTSITSAKLIGTANASYTTTPATVRVGCTPSAFLNKKSVWRNVRKTSIAHWGATEAYTPFIEVFDTSFSSLGSTGSAGSSTNSIVLESHGNRFLTLTDLIVNKSFERYGPIGLGGTFPLTGTGSLGRVQFEMVTTAKVSGINFWVEVWKKQGNNATVKLAESDKRDSFSFTATPATKENFDFTGANQISVAAGQKYYYILTSDGDSDASLPRPQVFFNAGGDTNSHLLTAGLMSHWSQGNFLAQKDYPFCLANNADTNKSPYGTTSVTGSITLGNWTSGSTFEIALDGTNDSQAGGGIIQNYIDGTFAGYKDVPLQPGSAPLIALCIHPEEAMIHERVAEARDNALDQDGFILEVTYSEKKRFNVTSGL